MSSDGELGRFLRDEVPGPGPGYWEEIDRRLANAAEEATEPTPDDAAPGSPEESDEDSDTGAEVIRLRDMTDPNPNRTRLTDRLPILTAVAAALVLLAGAGFLFLRDDDVAQQTEVATDGEPDSESTAEGSDGDATEGSEGDGPSATPIVIRWCYQGGELAAGVTAYADLSAPLAELPVVRISSRTEIGGQTFYEVVDGTASADGAVTGDYRNLTEGTVFPATFVSVGDDFLNLADDVFVEPVACEEIADDIAEIGDNITDLEAEGPSPTVDDIEFLADETPMVWNIDADGDVNGRIRPGLDAEIVRTYDRDDTNLFGTGRSARADDLTWIEIDGTPDAAAGSTWWIRSDVLVAIGPAGDFQEGGLTTLPDVEPIIWFAAVEIDGREAAGFVNDPSATIPVNSYLISTGRRAIADEMEWIEIESTDEREALWVLVEELIAPYPDRLCYASADRWPVDVRIALDWSDDGDTFRGYLRDTIGDTYLILSGRRSDTEGIFDVNIAVEGETDFGTEPWEFFDSGLAAGDTPTPEVNCALTTTEDLAELEARFATADVPPLP